MWRNILVPTDFSGAARQALQLAVRLAAPDCTVHVMHVITPTESDPYSPVRLRPEEQARQRLPEEVTDELLQQLIQDVASEHASIARAWRRASDVVGAILDYADTVEAELIVLGTHGRRGLRRFLLGSVAEAILRRASVPVLTVREQARVPEGIRHILVPTDFSNDARMVLREAARWAAHFQARLTLLHVLAPAVVPVSVTEVAAVYEVMPGLQQRLEEELARWLEVEVPPSVQADYRVEEGPVDLTILEQARQQQTDLIAIATHGRSGVARWLLGSVTERVLRQAPCPVLTLRHQPVPATSAMY
ncbi:Nucleotide-binding universal stress protein, UspA family [Rhodothermus profundi]|uniref:Nucleotide-binding universal stress protein, UspA family n=2 Tax=Rhodothermus profundi TaxID=633813 RepID=A0A1M6P2I9_9BACT|nr:Nucleotide-binding universal stress protein, UspA family [Rhodothermus profundi]